MSAISSLHSGSSLPVSTLPPMDPALEPASVRNGDQAAKKAYQEGLAFEDVLVNELSQELTATVPGLNGSSSDGLGGSSSGDGLGGGTGSTGGSDSSGGLGAYASLLPQTLTSSIMSAGGTGLAMQIARDLDPALGAPAKAGAR